MSVANREKQVAEAEELLGDVRERMGFAKGLFFGQYLNDRLLPYPDLATDLEARSLAADLRKFCKEQVDAAKIDRDAEIPEHVIRGLGQLGVLGACLPKECGGLEFSQTAYCRMLEVLGGHCGSTALFVNAHHSIGPRALVLFGTPEQQQYYLPKSGQRASGSARFALTEPEAGSDAANVQTHGHADAGRPRLCAQRPEALDHQRRHRQRADRDGPHSRARQRRHQDHGLPRHARHAGLRGGREAHAEVRRPRHGHGPAGVPRHVRAQGKRSWAARQRAEESR